MSVTVRWFNPDVASDDSRRISMLLGLLFGLAGMGSSAAALVLPLIAEDFDVSVGAASWTISLYVLMLAVTTAVYGRISDLVGVRLPLLFGIALMTLGALMAALAPSFGVLLVARMLQGAGAAAVPTLGVAILSARYDDDVRGLALGRLAGMAAAVSCMGPLVGGIAVAVAGVLMMALGAPAVTMRVRRRPHGFLPLTVISNPTVVRSAVAAAAVPAAWFAQLVAVPTVLLREGWEPWQVGVLLLPSALIAIAMPRTAGRLLARVGGAGTLALSGMVAVVALVVAALGTALVSPVLLVVAVAGVTVAFGLGQPALIASVSRAVDAEVRGVALGIATLLFLVGGSIGSAVVGGLGEVLSIPISLILLAALPLLGLVVLAPELKASRRVPTEID